MMSRFGDLLTYRKVRLAALILFLCPPFLFLTILGIFAAIAAPGKNVNNNLIAIPFALHIASWWVSEKSDSGLQQFFRIINILIIIAVFFCDLVIILTEGLIPRISW